MLAFRPSPLQQGFFDWVRAGRGSAVLIAVAGSGKTTTIVKSLEFISEAASVQMLAFNSTIGKELKERVAALGVELGRNFRGVRAGTFHSLGFGAVCKKLGKTPQQVETDSKKLARLFAERNGDEVVDLYGAFCAKLVSLAKGVGIGALVPDSDAAWWEIVDHHDLSLDAEEANEERAIAFARDLLRASNEVARTRAWIDFDDQLYLPILWKLRLWQNDWVFVDEAQDTNPIRRALAKLTLRPGGRLVAVGDPNQAIYGFTGATADAIEVIKREFNAVELPLTVSYRCPKAAVALVSDIVPRFEVFDGAIEGTVSWLPEAEGIAKLANDDVVLCRNSAPLVSLAFQLIAAGRGCVVLGKDIGAGLVSLVKRQKANGVDAMMAKLDVYLEREVAKFVAKGEEEKAERLADRVACIRTVADAMPEGKDRTVPKLIAKIEGMFSDSSGVLMLCTAHKSKGKEWRRVALLRPDLMPSKWARQAHQAQQEDNLIYVARTRFKEEFIFLEQPPEVPGRNPDAYEGDAQ